MSSIPDALTAALADRYRLDRELGSGGMATVYLAEDLKHHRKVAVKVLRPDLAVALGADRFLREIEVAARLQHPHILGVLDSGDAQGFFYYVMPYVEGETLRDRIARTGELPVADALRLLVEISEALAVAHRNGVVHRDIKPENILLSGRHAMVMDFGVAKAVTEASGRQQLTTAGVALGTPAYMAPEQATADPHMDGRVDIYAIGIMAYEMLTGYTPFHGLNPQQTLAAHVTRDPAPLGQQRAGLSPALEAVVMRCLAKRPADRFQHADELVAAFEPLATPSGGMTPTSTQPVRAVAAGAGKGNRRSGLMAAAVSLAVVAAIVVWRPWTLIGSKLLDPNVVAVLPFRVAGADPSVQYLRQGMVDLLQAKLTGEGGPRSADTRSVLAAVRDAGGGDDHDLPADGVDQVARKIGAGRVLQGSIVGPADHLVIAATLLAMPGGRTDGAGERQRAQGLVVCAGRSAHRSSTGTGCWRERESGQCADHHESRCAAGLSGRGRGVSPRCLPALDPSAGTGRGTRFDLCPGALGAGRIGWVAPRLNRYAAGPAAGFQYRTRLNPQDQLLLTNRLGSRFPSVTPWNARIADAEKIVQAIPESAEAWYYLADALFHGGRLADPGLGQPGPSGLRKGLPTRFALQRPDQPHGPGGVVAGDTTAQRIWAARMIALDSTAEGIALAGWDLLQSRGMPPASRASVSAFPAQPLGEVTQAILFQNPLDSITIAHQPALLDAFHTLAATPGERTEMGMMHYFTLLNRGRPAEAARWLDTLRVVSPGNASITAMRGPMYYGGVLTDTTICRADLRDFRRVAQGTDPGVDPTDPGLSAGAGRRRFVPPDLARRYCG